MISSRRTYCIGDLLPACPLVDLLAAAPAFAQDPYTCRKTLVTQSPLAGSHPRVESRGAP